MSHSDKLIQLQKTTNLDELGDVLGVPLQSLSYVLYGTYRLGIKNYNSFPISKKNGGFRTINSPIPELKDIQKKLSTLLEDCYNQILITSGRRDYNKKLITIAHGFLKEKSIISNAEPHRNKKYVLNIDLENFFGSIHFGRVYGFFIKNKNFKLKPEIAKVISTLVCFESGLPQGAPTSPIVSNLLTHILDIKLAELSRKNGLFYTRYADDLTFSTNKRVFPKEISFIKDGVAQVGAELEKIIQKNGFNLNKTKTRLQYMDSRQDVTGLIVNKKINVRREYRDKARILANNLFNGKEIYKIESGEDNKKDINYLIGVMSYIYNVRQSQLIRVKADIKIKAGIKEDVKASDDFEKIDSMKKFKKSEIDATLDADARLYRDLIFFKNCIINEVPLIICEGKTDIIYLRSALLSLESRHRSLVTQGKVNLAFLNHTKTISNLFKIQGGTGDLGNFISNYTSYCNVFTRFSQKNPVIILIDNDSGAPKIRSLVKTITKVEYTSNDSFRNIANNLYIMQTPLSSNSSESAVEDLFKKDTLSVKLGGKSFSYKGEFVKSKNYGKKYFAEYVVKPNRATIDFSLFDCLFDEIEEIKNHFKNKNTD